MRSLQDSRHLAPQTHHLEIDHIDGDYHNNEPWNLRFLCPNCHAQTDSFAGRGKNKYALAEGQLALFISVGPKAAGDAA